MLSRRVAFCIQACWGTYATDPWGERPTNVSLHTYNLIREPPHIPVYLTVRSPQLVKSFSYLWYCWCECFSFYQNDLCCCKVDLPWKESACWCFVPQRYLTDYSWRDMLQRIIIESTGCGLLNLPFELLCSILWTLYFALTFIQFITSLHYLVLAQNGYKA